IKPAAAHPDLIDLGRVMFRLDALEGIAREKAQSLGSVDNAENIDAIEVYLAYQNKLRERLGLEHVAPMRFFEVSCVTDADVDSAQITVRSKEASDFADYLATDWQPWDDVVSSIAPDDHARLQDQLIDAMGEEFDGRLEQQLGDRGLSGTESDLVEDAKRELGAEVRKEIAREIKGALRVGCSMITASGCEAAFDRRRLLIRMRRSAVHPTAERRPRGRRIARLIPAGIS
ncbi:NEL-type E3 ubiquitin ligase domain-containing protein, partial [Bradyrhizobium yuanmingense]|uniref:NEL-type E3 ubiquitin ligase domain-containing protein n=1 Tax=Bradyrhizobium yuanmingense TaxID=108015 RepID=UPI00055E0BEF